MGPWCYSIPRYFKVPLFRHWNDRPIACHGGIHAMGDAISTASTGTVNTLPSYRFHSRRQPRHAHTRAFRWQAHACAQLLLVLARLVLLGRGHAADIARTRTNLTDRHHKWLPRPTHHAHVLHMLTCASRHLSLRAAQRRWAGFELATSGRRWIGWRRRSSDSGPTCL